VAFSDDFGLLQPYADDDCREAVYMLCLPVDDCVHCFTFSHTNAILSYDKTRMSIQSTFKKQAERGNTCTLHYIIHILHEQKLVHILYITLVKCIIMPSENIETQRSLFP
jgi:hypothetical protein